MLGQNITGTGRENCCKEKNQRIISFKTQARPVSCLIPVTLPWLLEVIYYVHTSWNIHELFVVRGEGS